MFVNDILWLATVCSSESMILRDHRVGRSWTVFSVVALKGMSKK